MENLKKINVNELNLKQIEEHVETVLKLEHDEIIEYVIYLINEQYDIKDNEIEDRKMNASIIKFFNSDGIVPYIYEIKKNENLME